MQRFCRTGRRNSPVFRGDLIFLTVPVHPACPGIQVKKNKKKKKRYNGKKTDEEGQWEKQLECHFMSLSVSVTPCCLFSASDSHASDWKWLTGSPLGPKSPSGPGGPRRPCKKTTLVPCIQTGWMNFIASLGQNGGQMLNISISAKPSFLEWAASFHHYSKRVLAERWRYLFLLLLVLYTVCILFSSAV